MSSRIDPITGIPFPEYPPRYSWRELWERAALTYAAKESGCQLPRDLARESAEFADALVDEFEKRKGGAR